MKKDSKLLSTKLKMPLPRKDYIKRTNLFKKLEGIKNNKITLIVGAAGSGKTTIISSFIKNNPIQNLKWITLSENINSFSFWNYFLESIKDNLGQEKESILSFFNNIVHKEDLDAFLNVIVNRLAKEEDITFVIDDFYYIKDTRSAETIEFFIKNSSDNIHFVIITREKPPLYLTDMLMSGKMLVIDDNDLKITDSEGTLFLKETLKMDLDDATIHELNKICEGWIGGLQLMALAFSNNNNVHLIKKIKGLNKYVIDYLSNEILNSLGEKYKQFLVSTSILEYFNEDICNKLLGISNSLEIITDLMSKNLFIVDIEGNSGTFRYHNIFGEFLRLQFCKYPETVKRDIKMRAAMIFEELGNLEKSIAYLFEINEYDEALKVIESMGQNSIGWIYLKRIPLEYIVKNEEMAIQRIFYHFCNMEWEECRNLLNVMKVNLKDQPIWKVFNLTNALINNDQIEDLDLISLDEIDNIGFSNVTKVIIYLKFSIVISMHDQYNKSLFFIHKIENNIKELNNPYIRYFLLSHKSQVKEDLGELNECLDIYEEIFLLLNKNKFLSPLVASSYIGIIGVYLKKFDLEKAKYYFKKLKNISYKNISINMGYLFNLVEMKVLEGKDDEALEVIHKMTNDESGKNLIYVSTLLKFLFYIKNTDFKLINMFIEYYKKDKNRYLRIEDKLFYSRVLYHNNESEKAVELINSVLQETRVNNARLSLIDALLFKIHILLGKSDISNETKLLDLLREAIHYSYKNSIISPYILESENMKQLGPLLKKKRSNNLIPAEKNFVNKLIEIICTDSIEKVLSNREIEVLEEISTGATNKEIANKLCISISTVKTHIIKIFSKLKVSNRIRALEKAKSLGILNK